MNEEENKGFYKLAAIACWFIPFLYGWVGIAITIDPAEHFHDDRAWALLATYPAMTTSWRTTFALGALLSIMVFTAMYRYISSSPKSRGVGGALLYWITIIGVTGLLVMAVDYARGLYLLHTYLVPAYAKGTETEQYVVRMLLQGSIDTQGIYELGVVGLWYIFANLMAIRVGKLSKPLGIFGIIVGIGFTAALWQVLVDWVVPVGETPALVPIAFMSASIIAPIYYFWLSVTLWRAAKAAPQAAKGEALPAA